ncbi:MAG: Rrf2 family transcriptional regulator [Firmicutes bacterium]|nr:Rrf2 family transcriptional regulator [Bacillota bacterium]
MKISTRGRYALRMMLDLAENQGSGVVALKDIAARQDISKKYLEQIIPVLNRAGLLQTSRGFQGGGLPGALPQRLSPLP